MTNETVSTADLSETKDRASKITDYVRDCIRRINQGEMIDMQGLDKNVHILCHDVEALDKDKGVHMAPIMSKLITELDNLATAFKKQHANLLPDEAPDETVDEKGKSE